MNTTTVRPQHHRPILGRYRTSPWRVQSSRGRLLCRMLLRRLQRLRCRHRRARQRLPPGSGRSRLPRQSRPRADAGHRLALVRVVGCRERRRGAKRSAPSNLGFVFPASPSSSFCGASGWGPRPRFFWIRPPGVCRLSYLEQQSTYHRARRLSRRGRTSFHRRFLSSSRDPSVCPMKEDAAAARAVRRPLPWAAAGGGRSVNGGGNGLAHGLSSVNLVDIR